METLERISRRDFDFDERVDGANVIFSNDNSIKGIDLLDWSVIFPPFELVDGSAVGGQSSIWRTTSLFSQSVLLFILYHLNLLFLVWISISFAIYNHWIISITVVLAWFSLPRRVLHFICCTCVERRVVRLTDVHCTFQRDSRYISAVAVFGRYLYNRRSKRYLSKKSGSIIHKWLWPLRGRMESSQIPRRKSSVTKCHSLFVPHGAVDWNGVLWCATSRFKEIWKVLFGFADVNAKACDQLPRPSNMA